MSASELAALAHGTSLDDVFHVLGLSSDDETEKDPKEAEAHGGACDKKQEGGWLVRLLGLKCRDEVEKDLDLTWPPRPRRRVRWFPWFFQEGRWFGC